MRTKTKKSDETISNNNKVQYTSFARHFPNGRQQIYFKRKERKKKIKKKNNFLHHERNKTKAIHTLTQTDVIESEQSKTRSSSTKTIIVMIRMQISHREMALTASHVRFSNE